jgi:hypothetical protein
MAESFDTSVNFGGPGLEAFDAKAGNPDFDSKHVGLWRFSFQSNNPIIYWDAKAPGQFVDLSGTTDQWFGNPVPVTPLTRVP